jgi:hypothetical protein
MEDAAATTTATAPVIFHREDDTIVYGVLEKIASRARVGKIKYNQTMDRTDLSFYDWLNHLQEELFDAAIYVEKLKQSAAAAAAPTSATKTRQEILAAELNEKYSPAMQNPSTEEQNEKYSDIIQNLSS